MNIGIIGFGSMGKNHALCLTKSPAVQSVRLYDPCYIENNENKSSTDLNFVPSLGDLLKNIDGIIIASPNHLHKDHILEVSRKNIPMLCEKPLCCNRKELENIVLQMNKPHLFSINFNYRFLKFVQTAKQFISNNRSQKIQSVKLSFCKDSALRKKALTWRNSGQSGSSGGAFGDLGIHLIDLLFFLTGAAPHYQSLNVHLDTRVKSKNRRPVKVDDYASVSGALMNRTHFQLLVSKVSSKVDLGFGLTIQLNTSTFSYHSSRPCSYDIHCDGQTQTFTLQENTLQDPEHELFGWLDSLYSVHQEWLKKINSMKNMKTQLASFKDAVRAQTIFCDSLDRGHNMKRTKVA